MTQASPLMAMKTSDADQRVELRQDEALVAGDRVDERAEREADQRVEQRAGRR